MAMDAIRNANARMEPPVTMWPENASAHLDTLELCKSKEGMYENLLSAFNLNIPEPYRNLNIVKWNKLLGGA